jgi:hypothetical protein
MQPAGHTQALGVTYVDDALHNAEQGAEGVDLVTGAEQTLQARLQQLEHLQVTQM